MEQKDYLENKLSLVNTQLFWNGVVTIIAILVILFFPLTSFDAKNLKINFNLEWIIAFIVMVVGVVRAITLRSKKTDIESDISFHNHQEKEEWKCDFCGKMFKTKNEAENHEKKCKDK